MQDLGYILRLLIVDEDKMNYKVLIELAALTDYGIQYAEDMYMVD